MAKFGALLVIFQKSETVKQKFLKNVKNMNISSNNGPIELCEGLLDRYQQALKFRVKFSSLWESPVRAQKLTKILEKNLKNLNISSNNGPIEVSVGLLDRHQ